MIFAARAADAAAHSIHNAFSTAALAQHMPDGMLAHGAIGVFKVAVVLDAQLG